MGMGDEGKVSPVARSRANLMADSDPRNESEDGDILFVDSGEFPDGCEVGDKVAFIGEISTLGDRYGIVVDKVIKADDDDEIDFGD